MKNNICFAYYIDNKFAGWYADSFGSIRDTPKIYSNTEDQIKTIQKNFSFKVNKINTDTFKEASEKAVTDLDAIKLFIYDSKNVLKDKSSIELRIVECPFYDGKNPNYSNKIAKKFRKYYDKLYHRWCKELGLEPGIKEGNTFGIALIENYKTFQKIYPTKYPNNWIYADYSKVKEWASKEPTEFLQILKP